MNLMYAKTFNSFANGTKIPLVFKVREEMLLGHFDIDERGMLQLTCFTKDLSC